MKKCTLAFSLILTLLFTACSPSGLISDANERISAADRASDQTLASELQTALDLYRLETTSLPTTLADFCTHDYMTASTLAELPNDLNIVQFPGKVYLIIFNPDDLTVRAVNP